MGAMSDRNRSSRASLYWWGLANVLAIAFAIASWVVCLSLFRDPTHELSYDMMRKVGRIKPLQVFVAEELPKVQQSLGPLELEGLSRQLRGERMEAFNHGLLRAYLTNYHRLDGMTMVTGRVRVEGARALTEGDFLFPGVLLPGAYEVESAATGKWEVFPVHAHLYLPGKGFSPEDFPVGSSFLLSKKGLRIALLHVKRLLDEGREALHVTMVPISAGELESPGGKRAGVVPPEAVRLEAGLPPLS